MTDILKKNDPYQEPSFSLGNRALRTLWNLTYLLLFRFSPRPLHGWRAFLLKCFGAKLGRHCHVYPRSRIWAPWNLVLGDFSGFADDVNCYNMARVTLGKRVVVSQGVHLCTGTHDHESPNFQLIAKPIMLGDRAWLCAECFIGPGVTVGEGAVIGARAVVVEDMPAWTVSAGNPCRPVRARKIRAESP